MSQAGIPLFYLQGMGGGAVLKFRDLFNDSSLFWGWRKFLGASQTGKSGIEANGVYRFTVNEGISAIWDGNDALNQAPRIYTGILTYPCEIITRLDEFSGNLDTYAGLFIAQSGIQFGVSGMFKIYQRMAIEESSYVGVQKNNEILEEDPNVILPIWLRIRVGCGSQTSLKVFLDYSLDGLHWTNLYTLPEYNSGHYHFGWAPPCVGIYAQNGIGHHAIEAKFNFFQMKPKSIN